MLRRSGVRIPVIGHDRRRARRISGAWAACLALLLGCGEATQPNVLLYVVDTLRADALACYGNEKALTPRIDEFAQQGVLFENAFANSSWTRPSVASLLTGTFPPRHNVLGREDALPGDARTLVDALRERGYTTGLITANPNVGSAFGFDAPVDELVELYRERARARVDNDDLLARSDEVTQHVLEWIDAARSPFFLMALPVDPHSPYRPPERFDPLRGGGLTQQSQRQGGERLTQQSQPQSDGRLTQQSQPQSGERATQQSQPQGGGRLTQAAIPLLARLRYQGEVAFVDESFGELLAGLDERGLGARTVVVFTSDHGEEFFEYGRGGHGKSLTDVVLRVPLVIRYPGSDRVPAGLRDPRTAQLVDVMPTVLDLAGIPAEEGVDGRTLLGLPGDEAAPAFADLVLDGRRLRSVRAYPWKLVWNRENDRYLLFDLRGKRGEVRPLRARARRHTQQRLRKLLHAALSDAAASPTARRSHPDALSAADREALRALGYIE